MAKPTSSIPRLSLDRPHKLPLRRPPPYHQGMHLYDIHIIWEIQYFHDHATFTTIGFNRTPGIDVTVTIGKFTKRLRNGIIYATSRLCKEEHRSKTLTIGGAYDDDHLALINNHGRFKSIVTA
ncbi:hypothetical protein GOBAR_DD12628 [Gossypium barbadense]|nr:hypothetical protein GOBAR_DD12628 [Gossypium barbadense]